MGFSQGAGAAAILTAALEKPSLHPAFATCTLPPFRFAVIVAGFFPLDPRAKVLFDEPCVTPSLFIIGKTDPIVVEGMAAPSLLPFSKTSQLNHPPNVSQNDK